MRDELLRVYVYSRDVLTESGLRAQLLESNRVEIERCPSQAQVAVLAWPEADDELARRICQLHQTGCSKVLLVLSNVEVSAFARIVENKASGVLRSADASPERLAEATLAVAAGGGCLPPDLVAHVLKTAHQPGQINIGFRPSNQRLSKREEAVIVLLADGYDTHQIAEELHFSERTIKGVVHQVIRRFGLRNRSHAVAYALRNGLI